ncbi:MAG: hypothetical protein KGI37_06060 [Alphaproteobacteria bacterium]|nr:hypothetical protein [Alphaproteobacteria bacterium]
MNHISPLRTAAVIRAPREETRHFDLSDHRYSEPKALARHFPDAQPGDVFMVYGKKDTSQRTVVSMPFAAIRNNACDAVLSKLAAVCKTLLTEIQLNVFVVPQNGLEEAPFAKGTFFNLSAAGDFLISYHETGRAPQGQMFLRWHAARDLLNVLRDLNASHTPQHRATKH